MSTPLHTRDSGSPRCQSLLVFHFDDTPYQEQTCPHWISQLKQLLAYLNSQAILPSEVLKDFDCEP